MDYHLDTKVILSEEQKHRSLYSWSLREVGDQAEQHGSDQIPWNWTQYFTLSDIEFHSRFELGDRYASGEERSAPKVKESEFIRAKLLPYGVRDTHRHSSTRYSMFGTNRTIKEFEFAIYQIEDGKEESCSAWGNISNTTEIDFRSVTSDDSITFFLRVSAGKFARIIRMITEKTIRGASLRVGDVEGFYSEWSPAISTNQIKVLTQSEKYHAVEIPEGNAIIPPRLGKVGEFELHLYDEIKFQYSAGNDDIDDTRDYQKQQPATVGVAGSQSFSGAEPKSLSILKSLRVPAWTIAVLLLLILVK